MTAAPDYRPLISPHCPPIQTDEDTDIVRMRYEFPDSEVLYGPNDVTAPTAKRPLSAR